MLTIYAMSLKLNDSLGFLVNRAAYAMKLALEKKLARHDLTPPQWATLARLWESDGQPQTQIGRSLHSDRPTISGVIDRLERKNLVWRERSDEDRRVVRVWLTAKGRAMENKLSGFAGEINSKAGAGFAGEDIEKLKIFLTRLFSNMRK